MEGFSNRNYFAPREREEKPERHERLRKFLHVLLVAQTLLVPSTLHAHEKKQEGQEEIAGARATIEATLDNIAQEKESVILIDNQNVQEAVDVALRAASRGRSVEALVGETGEDAEVVLQESADTEEAPADSSEVAVPHEHAHGSHEDPFWALFTHRSLDPARGFQLDLDELAGFHTTIATPHGSVIVGGEKLGGELHGEAGFELQRPLLFGVRPGARVVLEGEGSPKFALTFSALPAEMEKRVHASLGVQFGAEERHGVEAGHEEAVEEHDTEHGGEKEEHENVSHHTTGTHSGSSLLDRLSAELGYASRGGRFAVSGGIEHGEIFIIPRFTIKDSGEILVKVEGIVRMGGEGGLRSGALLKASF